MDAIEVLKHASPERKQEVVTRSSASFASMRLPAALLDRLRDKLQGRS